MRAGYREGPPDRCGEAAKAAAEAEAPRPILVGGRPSVEGAPEALC